MEARQCDGRPAGSGRAGNVIREYLTIGLGIALVVSALAVWGLWHRLGAEQEAHSKTKASLVLWTQAARECSESVKQAESEANRRTRNAAAALESARQGSVAKDSEIARLRSAKATGVCAAADGVAEVRKGLK